MSFLETPSFPGKPSYGYVFRPRYQTDIERNGVGDELRTSLWSFPLYDCQVTVGPRMDDEIDELLEFYNAVGGEEVGFRVKNYGEYKSCRPSATPAATDQPMTATGVSNEYQLIKRYTAGAQSRDRPIYKPVSGTVVIADADGLVDSGEYTVDHTTGLVTFSVAPTGSPTWGGEFDLKMRFTEDFPIQIIDKRAHSVSFTLEEYRRDLA
jgi:uncharacterized protein (TIGR02217 family)